MFRLYANLLVLLVALAILLKMNQAFAITSQLYPHSTRSSIDILATVSDKVITSQDLNDRAKIVAILNNVPYAEVIKMKERLLEAMIDEKLLLQEGINKSIVITDSQIEQTIKTVHEQRDQESTKSAEMVLNNPNMLENIKDQVRAQLTLKELLDARKTTYISDQELEEGHFILPHLQQQWQEAKAQHEQYNLKKRIKPNTEVLLHEIILPAKASKDQVVAVMNSILNNKTEQSTIKVEVKSLGWLKIRDLSDLYQTAILETMSNNISQPLIGENIMIILYAKEWRNLVPVQEDKEDSITQPTTKEMLKMALSETKNDRIHQYILHDLRKKYLIEVRKG